MSHIDGFTFVSAPRVSSGKSKAVLYDYKMGDIDKLEGSRSNYIVVMVDNPKKPDSIAYNNWYLYGEQGEPTVTVAAFIKSYPKDDRGVDRARASLLWDLNRGYIQIVTKDNTDN